MKKVLYYFTNKCMGEWEKIYQTLQAKEEIPKKYYDDISLSDDEYLSVVDYKYPNELKSVYKPPFSLFLYGNNELLDNKLIGIYGDHINQDILDDLVVDKNLVYILDYSNHKIIDYLLNHKINFIAVSQFGINNEIKKSYFFQKIIENNNLIITEIPSNNTDILFNDQSFYRIIFGLSKNVILLKNKKNYEFQKVIELCSLEKINTYSYYKLGFDFVNQINNISDIDKLNCKN